MSNEKTQKGYLDIVAGLIVIAVNCLGAWVIVWLIHSVANIPPIWAPIIGFPVAFGVYWANMMTLE
jgi:hypothetical protein